MRWRLQFAGCLMALGIGAMIAAPCYAQRGRANWAQNRPADKPPKPPKPPARQGQNQAQRQQQQEARRAQAQRQQNGNANRPSQGNPNRPDTNARPNSNPNRPPSAYTAPARKFNELSPQEKQKVIENNRRYQNLSPAQKQQVIDGYENWQKLTPEQQNHIKNEVLPKWRQLPPDRQRAIQQRLGVLKNMPESARNQHLNDPNFTRGMSEEDKATLRDLSHMHVGGAPEPPSE